MEEMYDLDPPVTIFRFKGSPREPVAIDVVSLWDKMGEIEKQRDEKYPEGNSPRLWAERELGKVLKAMNIPGEGQDDFTDGELDSLWHGIFAAFLKKKKGQNDTLASIRTLQTSTEEAL